MDLSFLKTSGIRVTQQALLKDYTTFQLGGRCLALLECSNAKQAIDCVQTLTLLKTPFLVMGFGSNILASDDGICCVILRYSCKNIFDAINTSENICCLPSLIEETHTISIDACHQLDAFIEWSLEHHYLDLIDLSGIPGTIGGAVAGNAGAYGKQISDYILDVTLLHPDGSISKRSKKDLNFSYRDSDIKYSKDIILNVTFHLTPFDHKELSFFQQERQKKLSIRLEKHGDWKTSPCAGSFFKNVLPSSCAQQRQAAGWFLEQAGAKQKTFNGAHCYPAHANIITKETQTTSNDVYEFTQRINQDVQQKFGFLLEREVRLLGTFKGASDKETNGYW